MLCLQPISNGKAQDSKSKGVWQGTAHVEGQMELDGCQDYKGCGKSAAKLLSEHLLYAGHCQPTD